MSSGPSPYLVLELPDISNIINDPLKSTQRIKYTCLDVSKSLIAFGATSGGVYIFNRHPCEFVQLIPSKDGPIIRLSISPDEKRVAFANGSGVVTVTNCDLAAQQCTVTSKEHHGNEVSAMVWGHNLLFTGDDVGLVAVMQMPSFITKTIFQSSSQTIMTLDSRICQLDIRDCMLLISTLTRCYICDTSKELYRQIGQKLRDGEFGACFVTLRGPDNVNSRSNTDNITELKKYNIIDGDFSFTVNDNLKNVLIYCARPSSRLWEATIDGTVRRTHQFKTVLADGPFEVVSQDSYNNEELSLEPRNNPNAGQSCTFPKIFSLNGAIFSFKKDALYILNTDNVEHTLWFDKYNDILDCRLQHDTVYIWRQNSSLVTLKYIHIDKFLIKCFLDAKYVLCAKSCALYSNYLMSDEHNSNNLGVLVGLKDKLVNRQDLLEEIAAVMDKIEKNKQSDATQLKSGIYVVDNTYQSQSMLNKDDSQPVSESKRSSPETLQTLKEFSSVVTDKINITTKALKGKLVSLEEKVKSLSTDKDNDTTEQTNVISNDIIYKDPSQKVAAGSERAVQNEQICRTIYQQYRLSLGNKCYKSNLITTIENYTCDIKKIYELITLLEQYCTTIDKTADNKYVPSIIFLTYLQECKDRSGALEEIIKDDNLYKYFVDSCISVNMQTQKLSKLGCECGFPLPYIRTNKTPEYSDLIDEFIERQWSSQTREQCYSICKRMPYLWKKILYLRKNEDLMTLLRLLLQMLDESLLHTFLPQFSVHVWERAAQLYATLHGNVCLNCSKKFENVCVKDTLSWDGFGALMMKSVGGRNAVAVIEKYADLIGIGDITMKFYHTCLLLVLFEKYDGTLTSNLVDTLYSVYDYEDSRLAICDLLRSTIDGSLKNTSLPLIVAAKSKHWGLSPLYVECSESHEDNSVNSENIKNATVNEILDNLFSICNGVVDCGLCGLPLANEVLFKDGGLSVFKCGHTFHGACLDMNKVKLCPSCVAN